MEASTRAPMAMAMPPSDMMLAEIPMRLQRQEGDQHRDRNGDDRDEGARDVPQEDQHDRGNRQDHFDDRAISGYRWRCGSARSGRRWERP